MDPHTENVLKECKAALSDHYGNRLRGVVLYGSMARGDADAESDIDLLVLLEGPFDFFDELRVIVHLMLDFQLKAGRHISARPADAKEFDNEIIQLYRKAQREGLSV